MFRFRSLMMVFCSCALFGMAGCRGDTSSSGTSSSSTSALKIVLDTYATVFANFGPGLTLALDPNAEADKTTTISPTDELRQYSRQIICTPVGNGSMDGSVDDRNARGTVAVDIDFRNCAGVGGTVDIVGAFQRSADSIDLQWNYADSGEAKSQGCTLDLTQLTVTSNFSITAPALADSRVSGDLLATCSDGSSVTCSWSDTSVADANALAQGCRCTGPGC